MLNLIDVILNFLTSHILQVAIVSSCGMYVWRDDISIATKGVYSGWCQDGILLDQMLKLLTLTLTGK